MKIQLIFTDEKDLAKVEKRFREVALTHGIGYNEALRQALLFWLHMVPASSDFMLEVTDEEWRELRPQVERIRARRGSAGPQSSDEGPAS